MSEPTPDSSAESKAVPAAGDTSGVPADPALFDRIVSLTKRRGFVFPSAEIYGGFRSTYDYGPIGVLLLRNVKDAWWRSMVQLRHDVVGLDCVDPLAPGGVGSVGPPGQNFTDPLVDCKECKARSVSTSCSRTLTVRPELRDAGTFTEPGSST
jgi:glycyl-tRNA synthetase